MCHSHAETFLGAFMYHVYVIGAHKNHCGPLEHSQLPYFYLIVGGAIRQMQQHCAFPQVVMLKQKCAHSCHVTCKLPRKLIWEEVAPSHK